MLEANLSLHPTCTIRNILGALYFKLEDYPVAMTHYNAAIKINPANQTALKGLQTVTVAISGREDDDVDLGETDEDEGFEGNSIDEDVDT